MTTNGLRNHVLVVRIKKFHMIPYFQMIKTFNLVKVQQSGKVSTGPTTTKYKEK